MSTQDFSKPYDEFVRGIDIHTLLPQADPFVMIDKIEHFDMVNIETSTQIKSDNIFVNGDVMTAAGLIENIAQTCAARIGYINKYILNKGIQIGFIGAIKNLNITSLPKVGECISTYVKIEEEVFGMHLSSAKVICNDNIIVSTQMKIAIKEE